MHLNESGPMTEMVALLAQHLRCAECRRRYRTQDIVPLDTAARQNVFRVRCPMCVKEHLIIGVRNKNGVRTFATELDAQEWMHYRRTPRLNSDDVLRIVQMLKTYDGDFTDVLEDPLFDEPA